MLFFDPSRHCQIGVGAFHSGTEINGEEWAFGRHANETTGVWRCRPCQAPGFTFRTTIEVCCSRFVGGFSCCGCVVDSFCRWQIGVVTMDQDEIMSILDSLKAPRTGWGGGLSVCSDPSHLSFLLSLDSRGGSDASMT